MNKIITDKLIEEKLKEKGLSMYDQVDDSLKKLQDYYEFELTDSYNRTPDYSIFAESTADGYDPNTTTKREDIRRDVLIDIKKMPSLLAKSDLVKA